MQMNSSNAEISISGNLEGLKFEISILAGNKQNNH